MKKICGVLFENKLIILLSLIVSFLFGCTVTYIYDYYNGYYQASFQVNNIELFEENKDKLNDFDYLQSIKNSGYNATNNTNKYENINIKQMLKQNGYQLIENGNNNYYIKTGYRYYDVFFILSSRKISSRAKMFIKDSLTKLDENLIINFSDSEKIIETKNVHNKWLIGTYSMIIGMIVVLSYITIKYLKHKNIYTKNNYIIVSEVSSLKKGKSVTTLAMLFAMMLVCKFIPIPSGFGNLGISFTYLFFALIGLLYGPAVTFGIGILSDTIGFFINGTGYFFLGYTLQAAMSGAIYGICFYKKKVNFANVLCARFLINIFMNAIFGSILYTIVMTELKWFSQEFWNVTFSYMLLLSLPKNVVYLLPQSFLLFGFLKVTMPLLLRFNYLKKITIENNIVKAN